VALEVKSFIISFQIKFKPGRTFIDMIINLKFSVVVGKGRLATFQLMTMRKHRPFICFILPLITSCLVCEKIYHPTIREWRRHQMNFWRIKAQSLTIME